MNDLNNITRALSFEFIICDEHDSKEVNLNNYNNNFVATFEEKKICRRLINCTKSSGQE